MGNEHCLGLRLLPNRERDAAGERRKSLAEAVGMVRRRRCGASIKPKLELGAELLSLLEANATLGYQFGLNGKFTYCETTTTAIHYQPALSQCWTTHARVAFVNAEVHGRVREIEGRFWWELKDPPAGESPLIVVECGVKESEGEAVRRKDEIIDQAPKTPSCAVYPGPPVTSPDPWDGMRIEPCCHPLGECDEQANPPCCGLYGGQ